MDTKKYQYSTHIPSKYCKNTHINYSTFHNDICYVLTNGKHNSLLSCKTCDGQLVDCVPENSCHNIGKIDFLSIIRNEMFYIPKNKWSIISLQNKNKYLSCCTDDHHNDHHNNHGHDHDHDYDLSCAIHEAILQAYPKSCKCHDCYKLFGFANIHNFIFFVQHDCKHKNSKQAIYLVKSDLDLYTLQCNNLVATNEYHYSNLLMENCIDHNDNSNFVFNGVYFNNNKIYLSSKCGKYSYLWFLDYFHNLNYIASPVLITKLRKTPKGMFQCGNKMVVILDNIKNSKLRYYIIESPYFC